MRAPGGVSRGLTGVASGGAGHPGAAAPGAGVALRSVIERRGMQLPVDGTTTTLYVCVTCRAEGDLSEVRAGRRLHDALAAAIGPDPSISIVPVECLSACRRPCAASLAAPGKWSYVYGDLPAEDAAPVVAEAARLYAAAADGLIPWKLRPDAIRKGVVARIPPLPSGGLGRARPAGQTP